MRHRLAGRKFGRSASHRKAMMRNLATSLIDLGRIRTTDSKAKEVRQVVERLIGLGKLGGVHARRLAMETLRSRSTAKKLFDEIAPRYGKKDGGYTRIVKVGRRPGDGAPMSMIELLALQAADDVQGGKVAEKAKKKPGKKAGKAV